jgi:putative endonuclease
MFFVYILKSKKNGKYYVGSTHHLENRLKEHNSEKVRSTKGLIPLEIIYTESYATNTEARKRENCIKKRKSRKYIESLLRADNDKTFDLCKGE